MTYSLTNTLITFIFH